MNIIQVLVNNNLLAVETSLRFNLRAWNFLIFFWGSMPPDCPWPDHFKIASFGRVKVWKCLAVQITNLNMKILNTAYRCFRTITELWGVQFVLSQTCTPRCSSKKLNWVQNTHLNINVYKKITNKKMKTYKIFHLAVHTVLSS